MLNIRFLVIFPSEENPSNGGVVWLGQPPGDDLDAET